MVEGRGVGIWGGGGGGDPLQIHFTLIFPYLVNMIFPWEFQTESTLYSSSYLHQQNSVNLFSSIKLRLSAMEQLICLMTSSFDLKKIGWWSYAREMITAVVWKYYCGKNFKKSEKHLVTTMKWSKNKSISSQVIFRIVILQFFTKFVGKNRNEPCCRPEHTTALWNDLHCPIHFFFSGLLLVLP